MYLVLEYMKKGDLLHFLKEQDESQNHNSGEEKTQNKSVKTFSGLPDHELWAIFKQVVAGVQYLHKQDIIHGDIKPQVCVSSVSSVGVCVYV